MDLAKQAKIVDGIHDTLNDFVGQRLKVRANMGRSKIVESEGRAHPGSPAAVHHGSRPQARSHRSSILSVRRRAHRVWVELSQNGEPLFAPFVDESMELVDYSLEERVVS